MKRNRSIDANVLQLTEVGVFHYKILLKTQIMNTEKMPLENENEPSCLGAVSSSVGCAYWITPHLRYAKKHIQIDEQSVKWELRLQQMWQGQDGSQKWEWVEVFE